MFTSKSLKSRLQYGIVKNQKFLISVTIISILSLCLVTSTVIVQEGYAKGEKFKNDKNAIIDTRKETVSNKWSQIDTVKISKVSKSKTDVVHNNTATPISDATTCPINATFNQTKYVRLAAVGDTDVNEGTEKQFQMMNDCGVQIHIITGDLWHGNSSDKWFALAEDKGFEPSNTNIAVGNHDSKGQEIKKWLGETSTWNMKSFADGKVDICAINSNSKPNSYFDFKLGSTQFTDIKNKLGASNAMYKICTIHHPFMTVKSTHANNGAFNDYHPIFKSSGVNIVLQAHNHNYQRFELVDNILYLVTGTGTHDTGSDLYPLDSDNDGNGHKLERGKRVNGITIIELQIDNFKKKHMKEWFISLDGKILDQFEK